jgi:transcriptional regulator with XRE-family HTH domain
MFSERLKSLRKASGLLQQDMADKIGITKSAYGYYEQGKTIPDVITARKIADILDVSVDYLLGNSDFKKAPELTPKDEKDIEKTLEQMVADLESGQEGPSFYGGNMELSEYDREVMRQSLSETLRLIKLRNKEKYTPKKYKEDLSNGSM